MWKMMVNWYQYRLRLSVHSSFMTQIIMESQNNNLINDRNLCPPKMENSTRWMMARRVFSLSNKNKLNSLSHTIVKRIFWNISLTMIQMTHTNNKIRKKVALNLFNTCVCVFQLRGRFFTIPFDQYENWWNILNFELFVFFSQFTFNLQLLI